MTENLGDALVTHYAAGSALDNLATVKGFCRMIGETDAELRDRILGKFVVRTVEED